MDDVNRTTSIERTTSTKRAMHVVVVVVSAVSLSGCGWFMYRSNAAHTGESMGERVIGVDNVATLSEAWTTSQDTVFDNVVGRDPVVAGGRLYVHTANGVLSAFDADGTDNCSGLPKTCAPVWKAEPGGARPRRSWVASFTTSAAAFYAAYDSGRKHGMQREPPNVPAPVDSFGRRLPSSPADGRGRHRVRDRPRVSSRGAVRVRRRRPAGLRRNSDGVRPAMDRDVRRRRRFQRRG